MVRVMAEIRARAPIAIPGRRRTAARYRAAQAEADSATGSPPATSEQ